MSTITDYGTSTVDDDGSQLERNRVKFATIKTDLTDPLHSFITSNLEQANFSASAAPVDTTHHAGAGYGVGSLWVDTTNDTAYINVDATTSNGVWRQIGSTSMSDIASLSPKADNFIKGDGSNFNLSTPGDVRSTLGDIFPDLNTLGAATGDDQFIVSTGAGSFQYQSKGTARSSLGLGSLATLDSVSSSEIDTDAVGSAEIASGAVDTDELAADAVTQAKISNQSAGQAELKTTTASQSGSVPANDNLNISLSRDAFFPMIHTESQFVFLSGHSLDGASANNPRFNLNNTAGQSRSYDIDYRRVVS